MLAGACAKKPVSAPAAPGAPKFADFIYPSGPPTLVSPQTWEQTRTAWAELQSGDTKAADRQFAEILKTTPAFYPAEAGLGYSALARKDEQPALAHFDK